VIDGAPAELVLPVGVVAEVQQRRVATGQLELAVVEVGPAEAPGVVVAHGVGSSARFVVEAFAAPVLAAGGRLVAYDLRGHGASSGTPDPADQRLDDHVADLAALVAGLPAPPVVLGGISLGGHAAVRAAVRGVATSAVLACLPAWTGASVPGAGPHAAVAAEVRRIGIGRVIARLRADGALPAWLRETLVTDYSRHDPASLTAALLALDGGQAPSEDELRDLGATPLAVVGWPDDPGHPLAVAARWSSLAPRGGLGRLEITDLGVSRARLGEVAMRTLAAVAPRLLPSLPPPAPSGALGEDGLGHA
jgi:pimeloyl-ACP methyl ester carboxylesterase